MTISTKNLFFILVLTFIPHFALSQLTIEDIYQESVFKSEMFFDEGESDSAIWYSKKALHLGSQFLSPTDTLLANGAWNLAELYLSLKTNLDSALVLYEQSITIWGHVDNYSPENLYHLYNENALIHQHLGQYLKAEKYFLMSIQVKDSLIKNTPSALTESTNNLGALYDEQGKYNLALKYFRLALKITEEAKSRENDYVIYLNNIAYIYFKMGRHDEAEKVYEEVLALGEKVFGPKSEEYVSILIGHSVNYTAKEEFQLATRHLKTASKLTALYLDDSPYLQSYIVSAIGDIDRQLGQYKAALERSKQSTKIVEQLYGKNHIQYALGLNNQAAILNEMGLSHNGLEIFEESKTIVRNTVGTEHLLYATILDNIGEHYLDMEEYDKALEYLLESLETIEELFGNHSFRNINVLNNLGFTYEKLGKTESALSCYLEALDLIETNLGKLNYKSVATLINLGFLHLKLNELALARNYLIRANESINYQIEKVFNFKGEREKRVFLSHLRKNYDLFQSVAYENGRGNKQMAVMNLNNSLSLKGLLLRSTKNILSELSTYDDSLLNHQIFEFRSLQKKYYDLQNSRTENKKSSTDSIIFLISDIESTLIEEYSKRENIDLNLNKNWLDIKEKLQAHELAIEFSRFELHTTQASDSILYVAYLIHSSWDQPKVIYLFEEAEVAGILTNNSRDSLYASRGTVVEDLGIGQNNLSDTLFKVLLKPLVSHLKGIKKIYYSPQGILHRIPLDAIPYKGKPFGTKYDLIRLGSASELLKRDLEPELNDVTIIGGIHYDRDATKLDTYEIGGLNTTENSDRKSNNIVWEYLPGTMTETKNVSHQLFKRGIEVKIWTGNEPTEEKIKRISGKSPAILHLATHGFFYPFVPESEDSTNSFSQLSDPLLRSGLILAGANDLVSHDEFSSKEEDGIFTSFEISNLDLRNTKVVVLSACQTALGDIDDEGVYGLQRAFKLAGVDIIIMSLWPVPDKETAEFMNLFYEKWAKGWEIRKAFKKTQKEMYKKYNLEPTKWAAFVLLG